jgi:hypothetical protein
VLGNITSAPNVRLIILCLLLYIGIVLGLQLQYCYATAGYILPDCNTYIAAAKDIYLHHRLNEIRPIGISILVGIPLLFDASFQYFTQWTWILNFFCWLGCLQLLYNTVLRITNRKYARIGTLIMATNISLIVYTTQGLSEIAFLLFLQCVVYNVVMTFLSKDVHYYLWLCFYLLVCISIRPTMFYIAIIFYVVIFFIGIYKKQVAILAMTVLCFGFLHLYQTQMKKQFGQYTVSFIGQYTLLYYANNRGNQLRNNSGFEQETNFTNLRISNKSHQQIYDIANAETKNQLQHNTLHFISGLLWSLLENSTKGNPCLNPDKQHPNLQYYITTFAVAVTKVHNILLSFLVLFGWIYLLIKQQVFKASNGILLLGLLFLMCLFIMGISAISFYQHDRFHVVLTPIVILIYAVMIHRILAAKFLVR